MVHCSCLCVHVVSVCTTVMFSHERAGERGLRDGDKERERERVKCEHKVATACSPAEGVGTMLLSQRAELSVTVIPPPSPLLLCLSFPLYLSPSPINPFLLLVFSLPFHHHRGKSDGAFRLPEVKRTRRV